jgi:dTDP-4-dehydrorhamnose 3,5-epimerase
MTASSHTPTFNQELTKYETPIPGLIVFDLPLFGDNRGWFKENWQREKMTAIGLPDFGPVQNNFSFNSRRGTMRGIHAEPWDKFISVGNGSFFGAWVDIRQNSPTYGVVFTTEIDTSKAIFVPAGVANSYLTLEDNTVYSYLVNDHWHPNAQYSFVSAYDPDLKIDWPIPQEEWEVSDKDKNHPLLKDASPVPARKILVTGADGQLGRALRKEFPNAEFVTRTDFDITRPDSDSARHWRDYSTIINTAAYTAVDTAETPDGRRVAWSVNTQAIAQLSRIATKYNLTLVAISSDYVFDGTEHDHLETEAVSPINVYGQTKAASEAIAGTTPKHYTIRTSWVIGEGNNFVKTMQTLADRGIAPSVVSDQIGRLTFTEDLAKGIRHLLESQSTYGIYNLSNDGESASWADIAKEVYARSGKSASDITPVSTEEYYKGKADIAPRPLQSTLNLDKIKATGFSPREWRQALHDYLDQQ